MWKYEKIKTSGGAIVYDTINSVQNLSIGEAEIVEYAYDVVRAIGIEYGPVHGEYMVDEDGPVLIEVNCRPAGLGMATEYLDRIFGQHDTDSILDSYLYPERFEEQRKEIYRPPAQGIVKLFIVPEDILAKSTPIVNMTLNLKSYYSSTLHNIDETELFVKTEDLNTTCGVVFLVHENTNYVIDDLKFLRNVERNAFGLILSEEADEKGKFDEEEVIDGLQRLITAVERYGNGLIISDQDIPDINTLQIPLDEIPNLHGHFDYIILNLNKSLISMSDLDAVKIILKLISFIKVGVIIFIPKTTHDFIPGRRKGIEAILQNLNLKIEVPPFGIRDAVIASKR